MYNCQHASNINETSNYQNCYYPSQSTPFYCIPVFQPSIPISYQNMIDPMTGFAYPVGVNNFGYVLCPMMQQKQFDLQSDQNQLVKSNLNYFEDSNQNENSYFTDEKIMRRKFTPEEDERLRNIVLRKGPKKWQQIALEMPGRSARQCRDRYQNYLVPGFLNNQWTKQEDELLIRKYKEYGSQWSKMTRFFEHRNANSLKNRWNYYISKHLNDTTNKKTKGILNDDKNDSVCDNLINYNSSFDFIDLQFE